jgi:hypothetical protein
VVLTALGRAIPAYLALTHGRRKINEKTPSGSSAARVTTQAVRNLLMDLEDVGDLARKVVPELRKLPPDNRRWPGIPSADTSCGAGPNTGRTSLTWDFAVGLITRRTGFEPVQSNVASSNMFRFWRVPEHDS